MKLLLMPKSIDEIEKTNELVDGFIIGIKDLSTNMPNYFSMNELLEILKITKKEVFVSLNKNMNSKDLVLLKDTLLELEKMNIMGILYYDVSLVNLKQELSLKKDLVWSAEHMVTNSSSINFWALEGVNYAYLSSDITKEEIKIIKEETSISLMMNIFGYIPIFTSYRNLVKNYLKTFDLKDNSKINYIRKEGKIYPIEDLENTTVYSDKILCTLKECLELDIEYGIINSFNIDSLLLIDIIKMFKNVSYDNLENYCGKINGIFNNIDNGFLEKETIYKVVK